jgi:predicted nucleotidyltransferase
MTQLDHEIAAQLKARLSTVARLVDFRVFGSRARGDADEYSDLDVFIEVESLDKTVEDAIQQIAWEVGIEHLIHISPLVFTRHEIEETPLRSSFIVQNIAEEGVEV